MLRRVACILAAFALVASCSDDKPAKTPRLTLTYRPSPPVAGQLLELDLEGSDVGAVEIYQGPDLLTRLFNPLARDVPKSLFTFTAINAEVPRAVVLDADGNRIDVKATAGTGAPPPLIDSGAQIVDAGPVDTGAPDTGPTDESCVGYDPILDDGGATCALETALLNYRPLNARAWPIEITITRFNAGVCPDGPPRRLLPGQRGSLDAYNDQLLTISEAVDGGAPVVIRKFHIQREVTTSVCEMTIR